MKTLKTQWLRITVHVGSLIPLAVLIWGYFNDQLTADPIRAITAPHRQDRVDLAGAFTRLHADQHSVWIQASAKGASCVGIVRVPICDYSLFRLCRDWITALTLICSNRRCWTGVMRSWALRRFLILLPLAITSTKGWMKRLGQLWKKLHQWVYLAALLVIVHFVWLVKADIREPLVYGASRGAVTDFSHSTSQASGQPYSQPVTQQANGPPRRKERQAPASIAGAFVSLPLRYSVTRACATLCGPPAPPLSWLLQ